MTIGIFIGMGIVLGGIYLLGFAAFLLGALAAEWFAKAFSGNGLGKRAWLKAFGYSFTWPLQRLLGSR